MPRAFLVIPLLALAGCATILTGTSEKIAISTSPAGAQCSLMREGVNVGEVISTPATVKVSRDHHAITITCSKDGYQSARQMLAADYESSSALNVILGGAIGEAIDSSNGADSKYPDSAFLKLLPGSDKGSNATAQAAAAPAPSSSQSAGSSAVNWPAEPDAVEPTVNCRLMDGSVASLTASQCFDKRGHLMQGGSLHYTD